MKTLSQRIEQKATKIQQQEAKGGTVLIDGNRRKLVSIKWDTLDDSGHVKAKDERDERYMLYSIYDMTVSMGIKSSKPVENPVTFIPTDDEASRHNDSVHFHPFVKFLESLEYSIETSPHSNSITIDGCDFGIDTTNAAKVSRNAFSRQWSQRKPENRFIIITRGYKNNIIKIIFNKEYSADAIREKINTAIKDKKNNEQKLLDKENLDEQITTEIAHKYVKQFPQLKERITSVHLAKGIIKLWIENEATFSIDASGNLVNFWMKEQDIANPTRDNITFISVSVNKYIDILRLMNELYKTTSPLSANQAAWLKEVYSKSYNITKNEYSKH